jgi:hypothetical protein
MFFYLGNIKSSTLAKKIYLKAVENPWEGVHQFPMVTMASLFFH